MWERKEGRRAERFRMVAFTKRTTSGPMKGIMERLVMVFGRRAVEILGHNLGVLVTGNPRGPVKQRPGTGRGGRSMQLSQAQS